jgi:hypothetical protein
LWQVLFQTGQVAGPGLAGLLLARFTVGAVYWIDAVTYLASLVAILAVGRATASGHAAQRELSARAIGGGLRYVKSSQPLQGIFLADLAAMVLGMPRALFPAMGLVRFHGTAVTVGLLYAAPGLGAFIGALLTGWVRNVTHQGRAVLLAVLGWGVAIALFGALPWLYPALLLLAVAGAFDVFSAVFRGAILQLVTPPSLIGRVQAVQIAVVTGGPRLGDLEHGALGAVAGPVVAIVSGGVACVFAVALLARRLPQFSRLALNARTEAEGAPEEPAAT